MTPPSDEKWVLAPSELIPSRTFASHPLPYSNPASPFPWPDLHQSETESRGSHDQKIEQTFNTATTQTLCGNIQNHTSDSSVLWTCGGSNAPAFHQNHSFLPSDNLATPFHLNSNHYHRPPSILSSGAGQRHTWPQPILGNNMHDPAFDSRLDGRDLLYPTASNKPKPVQSHADIDDVMIIGSSETDNESTKGEPPYAQLIYNALMNAPDHKLVLRDIYDWISNNTDKAKDPAFKGWQNSVRHNLSMNGAFIKVAHIDPENKNKKGYIWVLDPSAVGKGIESTTRYRQKTAGRRGDLSENIDPKRQRSGRKGGRAARHSAKLRRSAKLIDRKHPFAYFPDSLDSDNSISSPSTINNDPLSPDLNLYHMGGLPYYVNTPPLGSPSPGPSFYDQGISNTDHLFFSNPLNSSGTF